MSTVDTEMDEMQEIIGDFLVEAEELVASLDTNLVTLEERPEDLDLLNEIFRAAHTIKGTSGFLGLDHVTSLTHKMEDVLNKLRKNEIKVTGHIMDVLLESVDMLKVLLADVSAGRESTLDLDDIKARLSAIADGEAESSTDTSTEAPDPDYAAAEPEASSSPSAATERREQTERKAIDQTIRVDVGRLDTLVNLMGELVLGRNSLVQSSNTLLKRHEEIDGLDDVSRAATQIDFITTEIQLAVMKMRMLPIGKVFTKFPRMVRDLSRDSGKKIELEIFGKDTELDKSVIEEIGDPLVHLIRNSCDHGIEAPADRIASGKPEFGTVRLGAAQEGSNIVITIQDDGKGLDIEAIKAKAVDRGLASETAIEKMAESEIFRFIFQPGFSTAKKITDVSGRGVGMDVVKTNIEKLKGLIDIESVYGKGTTISIKLPLTLAIIQGLLVVSEEETFIIPLASVLETRRISDEEIASVNKRDVILLREGVLPIVHLNGMLKGSVSRRSKSKKPYVVVVGLAEKRIGLIVDDLLGQEEVVIKSMGTFLGHTQGIAGATILGDGRVRLIVDLIGLFELAHK